MRGAYAGLILTLLLSHQGLFGQEPVASPRPRMVLKEHPQA
jgi:hypothetical protein